MVNMSPVDADLGFSGMGFGAQAPDYRFDAPQTVPGRYWLQATVVAGGKSYSAIQMVDAHEGDNDVVLALAPSVDLKGHLTVEGPGAPAASGFTVTVVPPTFEPSRPSNYTGHVAKDGSFSIKQVPPGEWIMNVSPNNAGTFEKSVRLGDKDFLYQKLEIPAGSNAPLNVVLSSNLATIEGEVEGGKRAGILVEPVGKWHNLARFYYSTTAGEDGKFKLRVAPGKYKIFALEKIATASFRNPESAELLGTLGDDLDVAEGAKVAAHPALIPEDKARELLKP